MLEVDGKQGTVWLLQGDRWILVTEHALEFGSHKSALVIDSDGIRVEKHN